MLAQTRLKQILHYNPETGLFTWAVNYNSKVAGEVAGSLNKNGYVYIYYDGEQHLAHRLAWLYVTGSWPEEHIDHRDRVRNNNRFDNLRDVSHDENNQNKLLMPGLKIYHNRKAGRCTGYMKKGKKPAKWIYFGSFANEAEVVACFQQLTSTAPSVKTTPL